jgi:hypothetical protein
MKLLTFAAGLAAGYVLGTRAGRERFDQLVQKARELSDHPTVVQAEQKAKQKAQELVGAAKGRGDSTAGTSTSGNSTGGNSTGGNSKAPRSRTSSDLSSSTYTTTTERAPSSPGAASAGGLAEPIG